MPTTKPSLAASASGGWQDLIASRLFLLVLLPALWAAAYLPHLGTHDLHHEEGRRAAPARAMLVTGDYILPTLYGDLYFNKPPGFFWVVAGFGHLLGRIDAWACRLPSALSLLLDIFLLWGFARRQLRPETRVLAALMLLASTIMFDKAHLGEIDALLSALVFWAMAVWFDGYRRDGQTFESWLWFGTLMAMAVLLKAPAGPAEIYPALLAFVLWERQWRRLFSWGHLVAILIMVLPAAVWVLLAYLGSHWTFAEFVHLWWDQIGGDTVPGQSGVALPFRRYAMFPGEILAMLLPWALFAVPMMVPAVARTLKVDRTLWRFLVCGVGAITLAFWLWPSARPRHMMVVIFPTCLLAAMFVIESARLSVIEWVARLLGTGALVAAGAVAVVGVVGVVLATHPQWLPHGQMPAPQAGGSAIAWSVAALVVCLSACVALWRITSRTPVRYSALSLSVSLAVAMLLGYFVYYAALMPYAARVEETRRGVAAIRAALDPQQKLFTTLTLGPSLKPQQLGRGDDFYNIQFYLGTRLRHFPTLATLHQHLGAGETCTVLALPNEAPLFAAAGLKVEKVTPLALKHPIEILEVSAGPQPEH